MLVPLPDPFVKDVRTEGLDALLAASDFGDAHRSALVKCAVGRTAFYADWKRMDSVSEYKHELFWLYEYDSGRECPVEEQVGCFSSYDRRT